MKYVIEVTTKVTLEIEDPGSVEKAIEQACGMAWQYDPDEQDARVVAINHTVEELGKMVEKEWEGVTDPELLALRQKLIDGFRKRGIGVEKT